MKAIETNAQLNLFKMSLEECSGVHGFVALLKGVILSNVDLHCPNMHIVISVVTK